MSGRVFWALPPALAIEDDALATRFDAALRAGAARAAGHLACRVGCTECCMGTFDITALDAARLLRGLAELESAAPEAAAAVRARAGAQWRGMAPVFPGDGSTAVLADDDSARADFFARFADLACPALDPATGACALYAWRPLSCRTFGLPIRCGAGLLAPCTLNFTAASESDVAAATVAPDPDDREGALLAEAERAGVAGDTTVCAALASAGRR